jgi:hypothetical protein
VELTRGRVPPSTFCGSRAADAPVLLQLGAAQAQVTSLAGPLIPIACAGYDALVRDARHARTVYYIVSGKLWGFGLLRARENPCR